MLSQMDIDDRSAVGEGILRFQGAFPASANFNFIPGMVLYIPGAKWVWVTEVGIICYATSGTNGDNLRLRMRAGDDNDIVISGLAAGGVEVFNTDLTLPSDTVLVHKEKPVQPPLFSLPDSLTPPFGKIVEFPPEWAIKVLPSAIGGVMKPNRKITLGSHNSGATTVFTCLVWMKYRIYR